MGLHPLGITSGLPDPARAQPCQLADGSSWQWSHHAPKGTTGDWALAQPCLFLPADFCRLDETCSSFTSPCMQHNNPVHIKLSPCVDVCKFFLFRR